MPIWDLKIIVDRHIEDDFDEEKKGADGDESSDDELNEDQQTLLDLVNTIVPELNVEINNKKFKKRGLRHLVELEQ